MNNLLTSVGDAIGLIVVVLVIAAIVNSNALIANIHRLLGGC